MKDPAGGVCEEEAEEEEEGGERKNGVPAAAAAAVRVRESFPSLSYPLARSHLLGEGPHLCLFQLWERDVEIEALRMVDSAEKRSIIVFLEQPTALELEPHHSLGSDPTFPSASLHLEPEGDLLVFHFTGSLQRESCGHPERTPPADGD